MAQAGPHPLVLSSSSSQEELEGKPKVVQQEEGPKGVDEQSESSEESEEEKPPEEDKEEEEEKKAPTPQEKKRRKGGSPPCIPAHPPPPSPLPEAGLARVGTPTATPLLWPPADSSDESDSSEESDIDSEASSALFMAVWPGPGAGGGRRRAICRLMSRTPSPQKKKTPPKRERRPSGGSSRGNSRPGSPSAESGSTSSTLRAAANKLEQGERDPASLPPLLPPLARILLREPRPVCPLGPLHWDPGTPPPGLPHFEHRTQPCSRSPRQADQ